MEANINYQRFLHVTAVDIDPRAVHMAYIQGLAPPHSGRVIFGGSLGMPPRDGWHPMGHVMGGWLKKLERAEARTNVEAVTVRAAISGRQASGAHAPNASRSRHPGFSEVLELYNCKVLATESRRVNFSLTKNSLKNRSLSVIPDGNDLVTWL